MSISWAEPFKFPAGLAPQRVRPRTFDQSHETMSTGQDRGCPVCLLDKVPGSEAGIQPQYHSNHDSRPSGTSKYSHLVQATNLGHGTLRRTKDGNAGPGKPLRCDYKLGWPLGDRPPMGQWSTACLFPFKCGFGLWRWLDNRQKPRRAAITVVLSGTDTDFLVVILRCHVVRGTLVDDDCRVTAKIPRHP